MKNVFDVIKNAILSNHTPTYGELISESRDESNMFNNAIRNMCSDEEYEEYNTIMTQDKLRLLNENITNQKPQQQRKISNPSISVSGIGEVTQIC